MKPKQKVQSDYKKAFIVLWVLAVVAVVLFASIAVYYEYKYNLAIEQGAENTLNTVKMVVACMELTNVTLKDIQKQYIKTFFLEDNE